MSTYYKYQFVSPSGVYAMIKEELKTYFDSGSVDDLMWPTYTNKCLSKLGKGTYNIVESVLYIEGFEARLPDNFYAVREAWLCADIAGNVYRMPNSFYSQAASTDTIQIIPVISGGSPCQNVECTNPSCNGTECMPELIQAVYKTNNEINVSFRKAFLLKPGNISVKEKCTLDCVNFGSSAPDSFDIRDNKFVVNFSCGTVYLIFYAEDCDSEGSQLIPDNVRIKEYIEDYIKYKVFETLSNQVNDETFNQLNQKMLYYKAQADEKYIMADLEVKKKTAHQKQNDIIRDRNRLNMYELPRGVSRWRRRNN